MQNDEKRNDLRMFHKLLIGFILLLSGVTGCQKKSAAPPMPDVGVPIQEMNKRFSVQTTPAGNSFRTKDMVLLEIKLIPNSPDPLAFHFDFGARLFLEQEDQWIEIKNAEIYQGFPGKIILSPSDVWPNDVQVTAYKPVLPDVTKTTVVRFVLISNIIKNGQVTDEKTGAYIDVKLKP